MNPEEALISNIAWDSLIEEFFIIGINSVDQAKSFFSLFSPFYLTFQIFSNQILHIEERSFYPFRQLGLKTAI